jgi:hypothetical protein
LFELVVDLTTEGARARNSLTPLARAPTFMRLNPLAAADSTQTIQSHIQSLCENERYHVKGAVPFSR